MNSITMMANIVCFIVVFFVAFSFITLAILYFKAQKTLLNNGMEDKAIREQVNSELLKYRKNYNSVSEAERYFERKKKTEKNVRRAVGAVFFVVYLFVFGIIIFSNLMSDSRHIFIGDIAMLTVKTSSMATADKSNTYLFDFYGNADPNDRIEQYSFITLSRNQKHISSLAVGDIAAFTMTDTESGKEMTVIHRIVDISTDGGNVLYTFRGDANQRSMNEETDIGTDKIVGVFRSDNYNGFKNVFLGHFICYLQSSTGIAMVVIALLLMLIFMRLSDNSDKLYSERYLEIKSEELQKMFSEDKAENQAENVVV